MIKKRHDSKGSTPNREFGTILEASFLVPTQSLYPVDCLENHLESTQPMMPLQKRDVKTNCISFRLKNFVLPEPNTIQKNSTTNKAVTTYRGCFFQCCKLTQYAVNTHNRKISLIPKYKVFTGEALIQRKASDHGLRSDKETNIKQNRNQICYKIDYTHLPKGLLVYRLDTSNRTLRLMNSQTSKINKNRLVKEMTISTAKPGPDKSKRVILLSGESGQMIELIACEQRTAVTWMEALDTMLGNTRQKKSIKDNELTPDISDSRIHEKHRNSERRITIDQCLNLASHSNNLICSEKGLISPTNSYSSERIYFSIIQQGDGREDTNEDIIKSVPSHRAIIKDSWDFYRMICSLLRDRHKYDEAFGKIKLDEVYPYLNSMIGFNDPGDDGYDSLDKAILQNYLPKYELMTRIQICKDMIENAKKAVPSLVEICKALAGSLGIEEVGVGPVKEDSAVIRKAEKKYGGDVLKVTDYCRALIVVKDVSTLLALLELARYSFGPLIRRVKLSSLKSDHKPLAGGYRDCKVNLELKEHICEIQIHIWPLWIICGVDGFRHYRHCLEYSTDSFHNPYDSLVGLDRKTTAELIVLAEEAVSEAPLENLQWYHENKILDYFAEVGLFIHNRSWLWAEITLRQLIKLRSESPDIGPEHTETQFLKKYLVKVLQGQRKKKEADEIAKSLNKADDRKISEKKMSPQSLLNLIISDPKEALDCIMDPNKRYREREELLRKGLQTSRRVWRNVREKRFKFLNVINDNFEDMNSLTRSILRYKL